MNLPLIIIANSIIAVVAIVIVVVCRCNITKKIGNCVITLLSCIHMYCCALPGQKPASGG